jgi:hypothetical protein
MGIKQVLARNINSYRTTKTSLTLNMPFIYVLKGIAGQGVGNTTTRPVCITQRLR